MKRPARSWIALCVASCLALPGCAAAKKGIDEQKDAVGRREYEATHQITPPGKRIEQLKELASKAKNQTAEEQQKVSQQLADEIRNESDPGVRRQILRTLANYPTAMASAVLAAGLNDTNTEVRIAACRAVGKQHGEGAIANLTRVVSSDTNIDVRIAAVRGLGETEDKAALLPLADALGDGNPAIQFRAIEAMQLVSGKDYGENIEAWQEYARRGETTAKELNVADKVKRYFR